MDGMHSESQDVTPPPMQCPRCFKPLVLQDFFSGGRHARIAACLHCAGQWLGMSDLERFSEIVESTPIEWRQLESKALQKTPLRCPECVERPLLTKLRSARDSKVVLDRCERCGGVWLDRNELRAIQQESWASILGSLLRR